MLKFSYIIPEWESSSFFALKSFLLLILPLLKHFIIAQDETLGWITGPLTSEKSQKNSSWILKVSAPDLCPKQGQLWDQSRLLKALSTWVLKTSGDGIAFQGNLVCCLTVVMGKILWTRPGYISFVTIFPMIFILCPCVTVGNSVPSSWWPSVGTVSQWY